MVVNEYLVNRNDFYSILSTNIETQIVVFWWGIVNSKTHISFYVNKNKNVTKWFGKL
jgi:hypothetical protein